MKYIIIVLSSLLSLTACQLTKQIGLFDNAKIITEQDADQTIRLEPGQALVVKLAQKNTAERYLWYLEDGASAMLLPVSSPQESIPLENGVVKGGEPGRWHFTVYQPGKQDLTYSYRPSNKGKPSKTLTFHLVVE